jgi:dihydropteroate synthase
MIAAVPASKQRPPDQNPPSALAARWRVRSRTLVLDRPLVMGILNLTPDSFSDGGLHLGADRAIAHAERMLEEGADLLDLGGESTRPGARPVEAGEEAARVIPVLRELRRRHPAALLSVDTVKSPTARAALDEGADAINDVSALRLDAAIADVVAAHGAGLVLMHSRGAVADMAGFDHARYGDVAADVERELREAVARARAAGVPDECIALDPGVGFAKRSADSLAVLGALPRFAALGHPLLVGVSRKRFIGELTGVAEAEQRVHGTTGANVAALALGARIFRVHDVRAARHALDVAWAVLRAGGHA